MNEIIKLTAQNIGGETQQTVNARELHAFLEVGKDFSNWIKDRIEKYGFVEGIDYVKIDSPKLANQRGGDRRSIEYYISLSMGKEIGMVERTEKGREVRHYFIECERKLKEARQQPAIDNLSKLEILQLAIESEQQRISLERQNKGLQAQIEEDAPMVAFAQRVSDYGDAVKLDIAAKAVGIPPKDYRTSVKELGWLRMDGHPMQYAIDRGYMKVRVFEVPHKSGIKTPSYTPLITGKGQVKVAQACGYTFVAQNDLFAQA
jgi:phage anti-repressor protein/phage antirepressor YoqD-like protein